MDRQELQWHQLVQEPNWAAAVESAVPGERGMTAVHSKILEGHMADAAAAAAGMAVGCSGHLMVVVLKRGGWHMAETEEQSLREHNMGRVLHDAERGGGGGAAAADGCRGSS